MSATPPEAEEEEEEEEEEGRGEEGRGEERRGREPLTAWPHLNSPWNVCPVTWPRTLGVKGARINFYGLSVDTVSHILHIALHNDQRRLVGLVSYTYSASHTPIHTHTHKHTHTHTKHQQRQVRSLSVKAR